jgi:predicted transcriptional regulator
MNSSVEKNYRNSTQIICDLLTVTQDSGQNGIAVTSLCQKGNLSHSRLRNFLSRLTGSGLVNKIEYDGKNTFVITEKGRLFLEEYTKFHEFAGAYGLEM